MKIKILFWIGLLIVLIVLSGCESSYDDCTSDCKLITWDKYCEENYSGCTGWEGWKWSYPDWINEKCYNECKGS